MILKTIAKILILFGDDILVLGGLGIIIWATFLLSYVAGMYVVGAVLLLLGYIFAKHVPKPPRRG